MGRDTVRTCVTRRLHSHLAVCKSLILGPRCGFAEFCSTQSQGSKTVIPRRLRVSSSAVHVSFFLFLFFKKMMKKEEEEEEEAKKKNQKRKVVRLDLKPDEGLGLFLFRLFSPPLLQSLVTVWCLKRQQSASFISRHIPYLNPPIPPPPSTSSPIPTSPRTLPPPLDCLSAVRRPVFLLRCLKCCGLLDRGRPGRDLKGAVRVFFPSFFFALQSIISCPQPEKHTLTNRGHHTDASRVH